MAKKSQKGGPAAKKHAATTLKTSGVGKSTSFTSARTGKSMAPKSSLTGKYSFVNTIEVGGRSVRVDGKRARQGEGTAESYIPIFVDDSTHAVHLDRQLLKVKQMVDVFGSQSDAASYLGVSRAQPGKWLSGDERPGSSAARLVQDFTYVWDRLLGDGRSPESAQIWLQSGNEFLDGTSPIIWLRMHGPAGVVGAIDAEAAGSYA